VAEPILQCSLTKQFLGESLQLCCREGFSSQSHGRWAGLATRK
jgi:hypothetical protein